MGQAATKAAGSLVPRAAAGAAAASPAHMPTAVSAASSLSSASSSSSSSSSSSPSSAASSAAALLASRGRVHMARTAAEIAAAASADGGGGDLGGRGGGGGGGGGVPEMPPDLLKFLSDAGPLRRVVDRELTSARVYDALSSPEGAGDRTREEHARLSNARVRRRMPLVKGEGGGRGGDDDGTTTERTTNFSTVDRSLTARRGLGVTREDYFDILSRLGGKMMEAGSPVWKGAVDDEYERITAKDDGKLSKRSRTFDELRDAALFEDSLKYIGVPVIMRDGEGDIIGVWHHKADDIRHSSGLNVVSEGSVQFVMRNESDSVVAKDS